MPSELALPDCPPKGLRHKRRWLGCCRPLACLAGPQSPTWESPGPSGHPHTAPLGGSASGPTAQRSQECRARHRAPVPHVPRLPRPAPVPTAARYAYGGKDRTATGGGHLRKLAPPPLDTCTTPRHTYECARCPCLAPGRWHTHAAHQLPQSKPAHGPRGRGLVPVEPEGGQWPPPPSPPTPG